MAWKSDGTRQLGQRQHGMWYRGRIFLFLNEENLDKFASSPEVYLDFARKIQERFSPSSR